MKVYISLQPSQVDGTTGVGQVVLAQHKYLPTLGYQMLPDSEGADIIWCHIAKGTAMPRVDVLQSHGLYFSDIAHIPYRNWNHHANLDILAAAREAISIVVPSDWVSMPFRRDMHVTPWIIPHGITLNEWTPSKKHDKYILYNKNRESDVCMSLPAWELANDGSWDVISTFQPKDKPTIPRLKVIGTVSHPQMKKYIQRAEMYLATTIETYGIGTLEPLACGVPVLGYDWGGTSSIVKHKVNGYLVEPGDIQGLLEGASYIREHRSELSEGAIEMSKAYDWEIIMHTYARMLEATYRKRQGELDGIQGKTAIIITNHNYAQWVVSAVESALKQTVPPGEIIVVDDGSTDSSLAVLNETYGTNPQVKIISQTNQGVAAARNHGIMATTLPFITCLDADDMLAPQFVELLSNNLLLNRGLGIAYSCLAFISAEGKLGGTPAWPPQFSWDIQSAGGTPPSNTIPSGCMFRRTMWERAGGYRQEYAPGEDAEFWTRGLATGFDAKKVSDIPLFFYRGHEGSASRTKKYVPIDDKLPWIKDRQYPMAAPVKSPLVVRSYFSPAISVIIPVGSGHPRFLPDALNSLEAQTMRQWEVIVVDDTVETNGVSELDLARKTDIFKPFQYVRWIKTGGKRGAGYARNMGIKAAKSPALFFLDADDFIVPTALENLLAAFIEHGGQYIYGDHTVVHPDGSMERHSAPEYNQYEWKMQHSTSVLMATSEARKLLFDENVPSWEDWEFFIRAAINGICGSHLKENILYYRLHTGQRRTIMVGKDNLTQLGKATLEIWQAKYGKYYSGATNMTPCCGGNASASIIKAKNTIQRTGDVPMENASVPAPTGKVRMRYIGENMGAIHFRNNANGHVYRGGKDPSSQFIDADPEDVHFLEMTGRWYRVATPESEDIPNPPPQPTRVPPTPVTHKPVIQSEEPMEPGMGADEMMRRTLTAARENLLDLDAPLSEDDEKIQAEIDKLLGRGSATTPPAQPPAAPVAEKPKRARAKKTGE